MHRFARKAVAILLLTALSAAIPPADAADPQPYAVDVRPTGNAPIDTAIHDSLTLISLQQTAPVGPFALIARARVDLNRMTTVLGGFGYYKPEISVRIDNRPLDDPGLLAALDARGATPPVPIAIAVKTGPLFHLRKVHIDGPVPAGALDKLGLAPGAPAVAADVLAAGTRLLDALRNDGYALATVSPPQATLFPAQHVLDVTYPANAGPRVDLGAITINGLDHMHERFVRNRLLVQPGELYNPAAIEKARSDIAALDVFSSVRVRAAERLDPEGRLPLAFDVTEKPLHVVQFGAAWSTDLGGSVTASWADRNLFGNAERLALLASVSNLGGTASQQLGFDLSAKLSFPDFMARDQSLDLTVEALRQYLYAYDQTAFRASAGITRKFSEHITGDVALAFEQEQIIQEGLTNDYTLLGVPVGLKFDNTNSLLDPTTGLRLASTVTPTTSFGGGRTSTFLIVQLAGSTYFDLAEIGLTAPGRSVLATRGLVGTIGGVGVFDIPPDQRFYAGGSGTVRGYRYLSIGPQFPDHNPTGGVSVAAGSVEFRQRFGQSLGAVVFVDAGQVSQTANPFGHNFSVGVGVGARYYTVIGPVRVDFALPVSRLPGGDSFELYLGIGQSF